jgi:hypothetical protein
MKPKFKAKAKPKKAYSAKPSFQDSDQESYNRQVKAECSPRGGNRM